MSDDCSEDWRSDMRQRFEDLLDDIEAQKGLLRPEMWFLEQPEAATYRLGREEHAIQRVAAFGNFLLSYVGFGYSRQPPKDRSPENIRKVIRQIVFLTNGFYPAAYPGLFNHKKELSFEIISGLQALDHGEVREVFRPAKSQQAARLTRSYHEAVAVCWWHRMRHFAPKGKKTKAKNKVADAYNCTPQTLVDWEKRCREIITDSMMDYYILKATLNTSDNLYVMIFGDALINHKASTLKASAARLQQFRNEVRHLESKK